MLSLVCIQFLSFISMPFSKPHALSSLSAYPPSSIKDVCANSATIHSLLLANHICPQKLQTVLILNFTSFYLYCRKIHFYLCQDLISFLSVVIFPTIVRILISIFLLSINVSSLLAPKHVVTSSTLIFLVYKHLSIDSHLSLSYLSQAHFYTLWNPIYPLRILKLCNLTMIPPLCFTEILCSFGFYETNFF